MFTLFSNPPSDYRPAESAFWRWFHWNRRNTFRGLVDKFPMPTIAADQFTLYTVPTITSISPSSGAISGGTIVTINGSGFTGCYEVCFGANTASSYTFVSDSQVTAVAPAESAGTVVNLSSPVPITANTNYVVSYHNGGEYTAD